MRQLSYMVVCFSLLSSGPALAQNELEPPSLPSVAPPLHQELTSEQLRAAEGAASHLSPHRPPCAGKERCPLDKLLGANLYGTSYQSAPALLPMQLADAQTWKARKRRPFPTQKVVPQPFKVGQTWQRSWPVRYAPLGGPKSTRSTTETAEDEQTLADAETPEEAAAQAPATPAPAAAQTATPATPAAQTPTAIKPATLPEGTVDAPSMAGQPARLAQPPAKVKASQDRATSATPHPSTERRETAPLSASLPQRADRTATAAVKRAIPAPVPKAVVLSGQTVLHQTPVPEATDKRRPESHLAATTSRPEQPQETPTQLPALLSQPSTAPAGEPAPTLANLGLAGAAALLEQPAAAKPQTAPRLTSPEQPLSAGAWQLARPSHDGVAEEPMQLPNLATADFVLNASPDLKSHAPSVTPDMEHPGFAMQLLLQADAALKEKALSRPAGRNALFYTEMALDLYSWNPQIRVHALTMLRRIHRTFLVLAEEALEKGQKKKAKRLLQKSRQMFVKHMLRDPDGSLQAYMDRLEKRLG
ncbi:hypothetical protein Mmc1_0533 [Magnetococcus marinus MC-1]|uniref:Uncharacterized protein n=1 Tax=Magnetococcus marinus (strain ATCC BAA-1437 / JCM 17883 / MC-1) TaxID=156889 RepID=A0L515_MAGMM|nr:hypothetical protein [Magnetococcus marinus]ABK43058.1 hypothetical protein Mmc1_0533 [Magnetococcus marinus MC-1]